MEMVDSGYLTQGGPATLNKRKIQPQLRPPKCVKIWMLQLILVISFMIYSEICWIWALKSPSRTPWKPSGEVLWRNLNRWRSCTPPPKKKQIDENLPFSKGSFPKRKANICIYIYTSSFPLASFFLKGLNMLVFRNGFWTWPRWWVSIISPSPRLGFKSLGWRFFHRAAWTQVDVFSGTKKQQRKERLIRVFFNKHL